MPKINIVEALNFVIYVCYFLSMRVTLEITSSTLSRDTIRIECCNDPIKSYLIITFLSSYNFLLTMKFQDLAQPEWRN